MIEQGSLKDWDDRHYQSIDDLPPEAWDAAAESVRGAEIYANEDREFLRKAFVRLSGADYKTAALFVSTVIAAGFKREADNE